MRIYYITKNIWYQKSAIVSLVPRLEVLGYYDAVLC